MNHHKASQPSRLQDLRLPEAGEQTLREAVAAVESARDGFRRTRRQFETAVMRWEAAGEIGRAAFCAGQAMAYESAADHITEALVDAFGLWKTYDSFLAEQPQDGVLSAADGLLARCGYALSRSDTVRLLHPEEAAQQPRIRSARPLGIAFVLVSYAPDTPAGMERATAVLAQGLRCLGHRTVIVTATPQRHPAPDVIPLQSLQLQFPADDGTLRAAIDDGSEEIGAELREILDTQRIDMVVYVDALWGLGRVMARHPARKVLAMHVVGHDEDLTPALADADVVIAPSEAVLGEARVRGYDTCGWQIIPNACLLEREPAVSQAREQLRVTGPIRVLARPAENKGVHELLEAVPRITDRRIEVILGMAPFEIAQGEQQSVIDRCTQAATGRDIRICTHALRWRRVPTWLAGAAVVIVPSHAETFGLVALEAMSVGTPVVAYDIGNLPQLLGSGNDVCGRLVSHGEGPAGLWRAALALIEDPVAYLRTSGAAYYRSRDFRPTSIAERFMKAVW